MENRDILTLLKLVLKHFRIDTEKEIPFKGLCGYLFTLQVTGLITAEEERVLLEYIEDNRPQHKDCDFSWPTGIKSPRIFWLQIQIDTLSTKTVQS